MALTEAVIRMNFTLAKKQAEELEDIARRLEQLSNNDLEGTLQNVSENWKGENASAYLSKGGRLQGKINMTSRDLLNIANDIRTIATRIYKAEMANFAIAQTHQNNGGCSESGGDGSFGGGGGMGFR